MSAAKVYIPWQLKIAAKLVLARIPLDHRRWKKAGVFNLGGMERPDYALNVFRGHFDRADFPRKNSDFVGLELGPGDSLFSALIARTLGASRIYLVDVGPFAWAGLDRYHRLESYLRQLGLQPPSLSHCKSVEQVAEACAAEYLTEGLASLRTIPSASVDFVWSHAVLQVVRRREFLPTLMELRRIQRSDGVGSHTISVADFMGGNLNDLRFSDRVWESPFVATSGFYTNRFRYSELLGLFRQAGFEPQVTQVTRWDTLPTARRKMAPKFSALSEEELRIRGLDVLLH